MINEEDKNKVKSLSKAIKLIEKLIYKGEPVSLTALSNDLDIAQSTIHRLLSSLKMEGFVNQDRETKKYEIGGYFKRLALSVYQQNRLLDEASTYLESLTNKTGETSNLVILAPDQSEVVYIKQVTSNATVKGFSLIGSRAPAYATGVGKVLLAHKNWTEVSNILGEDGLEALTDNTITDLGKLKSELENVAEKGFAVDREECEKGAACIAAPVRDHKDEVKASMSISGPPGRLLGDNFSKFVQMTKEEAKNLSRELGFNFMKH